MYAETTRVPVAQTKGEIEKLIMKHGGTAFGMLFDPPTITLMFRAQGRHVRMTLRLPDKASDQVIRARWRALLLVLKAKFESVEAKIETFEEVFLPHIVLADGSTVYQEIKPRIAEVYQSGRTVPLLPPPEASDANT